MVNTLLIIIGIVFIVVGFAFLIGFQITASYVNNTASPTPITNGIGAEGNNIVGTVGGGLIIIGIIFIAVGLLTD